MGALRTRGDDRPALIKLAGRSPLTRYRHLIQWWSYNDGTLPLVTWPPQMPDHPHELPRMNLLGLTLALDSNALDDPHAASAGLRRLRDSGWLSLQRSDAMETEQADANPDTIQRLDPLRRQLPETMGPWVLGYSRIGHMVIGSEAEGGRHAALVALLQGQRTKPRPQDVFDAMHVHNASRYGARALITRDDRVLKKAEEARAILGSTLELWTPERALGEATVGVAGHRHLQAAEGFWLPTYPVPAELDRLQQVAMQPPAVEVDTDLTGYTAADPSWPSHHTWAGGEG